MTKNSLTGIQVSNISAFPINNESYDIRNLFCFLYKKDRCMYHYPMELYTNEKIMIFGSSAK